jgi:hypothetical protein
MVRSRRDYLILTFAAAATQRAPRGWHVQAHVQTRSVLATHCYAAFMFGVCLLALCRAYPAGAQCGADGSAQRGVVDAAANAAEVVHESTDGISRGPGRSDAARTRTAPRARRVGILDASDKLQSDAIWPRMLSGVWTSSAARCCRQSDRTPRIADSGTANGTHALEGTSCSSIHEVPNLSRSIAKRFAKKVFSIFMKICPPSVSTA